MGSDQQTSGTATADPTAPSAALPHTRAEVRARREALRRALIELEEALSRPVGHGTPFRRDVTEALEQMRRVLDDHVRETEGEGGLLAQLEHDAPWLAGRVTQLRGEHEHLVQRAADLAARCRGETGPETIRADALELLGAVSRHRHAGTDLLYDAYMVDISAAD